MYMCVNILGFFLTIQPTQIQNIIKIMTYTDKYKKMQAKERNLPSHPIYRPNVLKSK